MPNPSAHDLELIARVRENPRAYLSPGRTTDLRDIALELANDALYLGAEAIDIRRLGLWFLVSASIDWIAQESRWSPPEVFFRIQLFHAYRQNATRATILPTAFAEDVATFVGATGLVVQGCTEGFTELEAYVRAEYRGSRVVAFRGSRP